MDEFALKFNRHLSGLKTEAFTCMATGEHGWIKRRAKRAIVNGVQVVSIPCRCGTEKRTWRLADGQPRSKYFYPEGYLREPGCGPRTRELNTAGFAMWRETLPLVDEL